MSPPTTKAEDTGAPPSSSPNKRPLQKSLPLSPRSVIEMSPSTFPSPPLCGGRCRGATEGGPPPPPQIPRRVHSRSASPFHHRTYIPIRSTQPTPPRGARMTKTTIPRSAFGPANGTLYPKPPSPRPILTKPQRSKHRPKSSKIDHNRPRSSTRRRNPQPTAANSLISLGIASARAHQPRPSLQSCPRKLYPDPQNREERQRVQHHLLLRLPRR